MTYTVGSCQAMCPSEEVAMRQRERLLHQFEIEGVDHRGKPIADPRKTVKQFQRSAAGGRPPKPSDIRPEPVLKKTLIYLMTNILNKTDVPWNVVYDFIFDRLRAIRQDLVIQHATGPECIYILETAVRFYIYSSNRLCEEPISIFDPHINASHLQECLKQVLRLYEDETDHTNHSEMITYYALRNLESTEAVHYILSLPESIRSQKTIKHALAIMLYWRQMNYVRVMRLTKSLSTLEMYLLNMHLQKIRKNALTVMSTAYNSRNCAFPVHLLTRILNFNDDLETAFTCKHYKIEVDDKYVKFLQRKFTDTEQELPLRKEWLSQRFQETSAKDMILKDGNSNKYNFLT